MDRLKFLIFITYFLFKWENQLCINEIEIKYTLKNKN